MKKQSVIKAIIAILAVIIAISAILVYVVLSGGNGTGVTSIKDIQEHPNRYINQTVIITGTLSNHSDIVVAFVDTTTGMVTDESGKINIIIPMNVKQPAPYVQFGAKYRFTGIVRYGEVYYAGPGKFPGPGIYLEITKIEAT
jgi:hypothetical protein